MDETEEMDSRKNPYAKYLKKHVPLRLVEETISYFKSPVVEVYD